VRRKDMDAILPFFLFVRHQQKTLAIFHFDAGCQLPAHVEKFVVRGISQMAVIYTTGFILI